MNELSSIRTVSKLSDNAVQSIFQQCLFVRFSHVQRRLRRADAPNVLNMWTMHMGIFTIEFKQASF